MLFLHFINLCCQKLSHHLPYYDAVETKWQHARRESLSFYGTVSCSIVLFRSLLISASVISITYSNTRKKVPFSIPCMYWLEKQSSAHLTGLLLKVFFHLLNYTINVGIFSPLILAHCVFLEFANPFPLFLLLYPLGWWTVYV